MATANMEESGKSTPKGVYKNPRFMHVSTSIVGCAVQLQTKDGSIWEGIFTTFSAEFSICLDLAVQIDPKFSSSRDCLYQTLKNGVKAQEKAFFDLKDIVRITVVDVDLNAIKEMDKLATDVDISGFNASKNPGKHRELESWQDDDGDIANEDSLMSLDDGVAANKNGSQNNSRSGWGPQEMFEFNERVHKVNSTYDQELREYTIPLPKPAKQDKDWRKKQERAAAIAREIESNPQSQGRLAKEDGSDDEEEKFSAVVRPGMDQKAAQQSSPQQQQQQQQQQTSQQQQRPQPQTRSQQQPRQQPQSMPQQQQVSTQQKTHQNQTQSPQQHQQNQQSQQQQMQSQSQNQQSHAQSQHSHQSHQQQSQPQQPQQSPQQPQSTQHQQQPALQHPHQQTQPQPQRRMNNLRPRFQPNQRFESNINSLKNFNKQFHMNSPNPMSQPNQSNQMVQSTQSSQSSQSSQLNQSPQLNQSNQQNQPNQKNQSNQQNQPKDQSEIAKNSKLNPNAKEFVYKPRSPATSLQGAPTNGAANPAISMDPANSSPMSQPPHGAYYQQVPVFSHGLPHHPQQHAQFMTNHPHMHFQSQIHYMPAPMAPHFAPQQMSPRYIRGNFQNYHHQNGEHMSNVRAAYPQSPMVAPTSSAGQPYVPSPSGGPPPHPMNAYAGSPQQPMMYGGPQPQSVYPMVPNAGPFPQHMTHVPNPPPYDGSGQYMPPTQNYVVNQ